MSWSVQVGGRKAAVLAAASDRFDEAAAHYEGREEGQDILAARARALSMVAELEDDEGCIVEASGSRARGSGFSVLVRPFPIAEAPAAEPEPAPETAK